MYFAEYSIDLLTENILTVCLLQAVERFHVLFNMYATRLYAMITVETHNIFYCFF